MLEPDSVQGQGKATAIGAGLAVFAISLAVGASVAWLSAEKDTERARAAVSTTASSHAAMLHGALARTISTTHAIAAVMAAGAGSATDFARAAERLSARIGGVACSQFVQGGHVKHAWPNERCAKLLGGDAKRLLMFAAGGDKALHGPIDLPSKQLAVIGRVATGGAAGGTVIATLPIADVVAEARLLELPGQGWTFALLAPLQGDRVLAASAQAPTADGVIAEIPVSVGNVTLVLRVGRTAAKGPLLGWAAAIVLLVSLLMARLGHGLVAQAAQYQAERRMRERLQDKVGELQANLKQLEERKARLTSSDRVTGLPDARYLSKYLDRRWLDFATDRKPIALMLIEIDRFDLLFESEGPQKSESALRQVGEIVTGLAHGEQELAVRFRGTAYALFFRAGADDPASRAEQVRAGVARLQIPNPQSPIAAMLTVSVGAVTGIPRPNESIRSFAQAAEAALKEARTTGQNRTVVHTWPKAVAL